MALSSPDLHAPGVVVDDRPRRPGGRPSRGDRVFRAISAAAAYAALIIIGTTAVFLVVRSREAFRSSGVVDFFTTSTWNPSTGSFGVFGLLVMTVMVAVVAVMIAVPLGLGLALFINEYAPARLRSALTGAVDLLAALPSLIFGIWALFALAAPIQSLSRWLAEHLSAVPFFRTEDGATLSNSVFLAGVVVGIMITPVVTSVSRDVMAQCPREQVEGALGLGGSRWGMLSQVVLPFARSGTVGAVLLGFGRALGETIAVALVLSWNVELNTRILTESGGTVASTIAVKFGEANQVELSGLVAAGLALFVVTLVVNVVARGIVNRATVA